MGNQRYPWTVETDAFIRENWGKKTYREMSGVLKIPAEAIRFHARTIGALGCMVDKERDEKLMQRWRRELE